MFIDLLILPKSRLIEHNLNILDSESIAEVENAIESHLTSLETPIHFVDHAVGI